MSLIFVTTETLLRLCQVGVTQISTRFFLKFNFKKQSEGSCISHLRSLRSFPSDTTGNISTRTLDFHLPATLFQGLESYCGSSLIFYWLCQTDSSLLLEKQRCVNTRLIHFCKVSLEERPCFRPANMVFNLLDILRHFHFITTHISLQSRECQHCFHNYQPFSKSFFQPYSAPLKAFYAANLGKKQDARAEVMHLTRPLSIYPVSSLHLDPFGPLQGHRCL